MKYQETPFYHYQVEAGVNFSPWLGEAPVPPTSSSSLP